jgi:predicted nicotinamide N-methyase
LTDPEGYEVKLETVTGCGADLQIRSLLDKQQFHDPLGEAAAAGVSEEAWSLFGVVWPSARVLANAMLTQPLGGRRILEVGCGLALASLVLHRRAGEVVASDCHPLVPEFLKRNLKLNDLGPMEYLAANWARPNPRLGRFDLIIGSDVLYERGGGTVLSTFVKEHAEARSTVVLVDPNRSQRTQFGRDMDALGFELTSAVITAAPGLEERYQGRLLTWRRS